MTDSSSPNTPAASLDDLVALNDEIGALVRAGVPLEIGLSGFAMQAPRRLAGLSGRLAEKMGGGQSLIAAIDAEGDAFPRVYRYVIEAGLRAGRLPEAVESLSAYTRNLIEIRRRIALSIIYPCLILIAAYYMFWFAVGGLSAAMLEFAKPSGTPSFWSNAVQSAHITVETLGHLPPALFVLMWIAWEVSSRFARRNGGIAGIGMRWIPGLAGAIRLFRLANFAQLAALLVEREVPAAEALALAAESSGDHRLIDDVKRFETVSRRGESLAEATSAMDSLPPFMRWMIRNGVRQNALAASLEQVNQIYRRRAIARSERFSIWFPILVTVFVGGATVLLYGYALFAPLRELLQTISST